MNAANKIYLTESKSLSTHHWILTDRDNCKSNRGGNEAFNHRLCCETADNGEPEEDEAKQVR